MIAVLVVLALAGPDASDSRAASRPMDLRGTSGRSSRSVPGGRRGAQRWVLPRWPEAVRHLLQAFVKITMIYWH